MNRMHVALAVAAALATTASLAESGDAWYGTNQNSHLLRSDRVEVTPVRIDDGADRDLTLYEADRIREPVIVEREYIVREPRYVVITRDDPAYDPLHPSTGQRIGQGLFPRQGPNDFGQ